ncbi:iron uptake porin [Pseudanabaena sp. ABRG5-3]|uniref:iron uptake porin n=1 Tax=Pseudanabaena sp. ABRG5-3 TaxID=685565 RepID=UPI000DC6E824|nr:iron uptake porin [Pseudanabaena sp. ABRG5-3]BBC25611.1 carbohydrate-selective porin [Pseudanabaena sp. ABRG5-3]
MLYIQKSAIQPLAVVSILLTSFNLSSANANELKVISTSANANIANTFQKIEKDTLVETPTLESDKTAQNVTSVSQLTDVKPTDWAFTALQSLVERYGCIAGYPDRTYRGKQATSRYEFAAGLNACLDKINEIISAGLADKVSKEDLATLQKLQEEFAAELATLRGRVDALDAKVSKLEAQQFSTTTKLNATVIFALADTFGGVGTGTALQNPQKTTDATNLSFSYRARLNFDTSFTGKDLLRLRLQAGNNPNLGNAATTNTNMARLAFAQDTGNTFQVDKFYYRFPIANSLTGYVGVNALDPDDIANTLNPYFESSDRGALSRFGRFDPLLFRGPSGAGIGLVYKVSPEFTASVSYLANSATAANATRQGGLFGGGYIANVQLVYAPTPAFKFGAVYARSFETAAATVNVSGSTGSNFGNQPFGNTDTSTDRYGAQFNWQAAKGFNVGGWIGFANARQESGVANNANLFNWSLNLAFPDLFADGNTGGIIFGQPPKVTSNSIASRIDPDTSYLLELQYNIRVSKNISITPGIFAVFNPNQNALNPTTWVATVRTLFSF